MLIQYTRPLEDTELAVFISIDAPAPCVIIERLSGRFNTAPEFIDRLLCLHWHAGGEGLACAAAAASGKSMHLENK